MKHRRLEMETKIDRQYCLVWSVLCGVRVSTSTNPKQLKLSNTIRDQDISKYVSNHSETRLSDGQTVTNFFKKIRIQPSNDLFLDFFLSLSFFLFLALLAGPAVDLPTGRLV